MGTGDFEMSLYMDVNFVTTYTSNITGSTGDSDVWDSTDFVTLPIIGTITAENAECQSSINITITTLDSIGVTLTFTGTDTVSAPVPVMLPANVTVTNDASDDSAWMIFNGRQPVSIVTGTGNSMFPLPSSNELQTRKLTAEIIVSTFTTCNFGCYISILS